MLKMHMNSEKFRQRICSAKLQLNCRPAYGAITCAASNTVTKKTLGLRKKFRNYGRCQSREPMQKRNIRGKKQSIATDANDVNITQLTLTHLCAGAQSAP
jgi:hypothetical protein